ncbi:hypothetical protein SFR_0836 [Streptomyces sp. FR-008]|nr:hypothetical protein SFR_0836 [Streptomyces sp. FR-008]
MTSEAGGAHGSSLRELRKTLRGEVAARRSGRGNAVVQRWKERQLA